MGESVVSKIWYVRDGHVEEYCGQEANWNNEIIVSADLPEDALIKALMYYRKELKRQKILYNGTMIFVIS